MEKTVGLSLGWKAQLTLTLQRSHLAKLHHFKVTVFYTVVHVASTLVKYLVTKFCPIYSANLTLELTPQLQIFWTSVA